MITPAALTARTALQSSGGSGISLDLILLLGIAAAIVLLLVWMLTSNKGAD